jgi:outer membrane protein OmpA-like peptidoglycan-associated protein
VKAAAVAATVALAMVGCAQPPKPAPQPQYTERVILLPSRDGRPSAIVVQRESGEHELATPYHGLDLTGSKEQPVESSAEEVAQRYGELLQAQPARPFSYTLFFITGRTELTPQSRAALKDVRQKIKSFPAAQVSVIGHADRVGSIEANDALSLRRASAIRDLLVEIGIPRETIEIVGRGEREPLVQTANGVADERNRRVEIKLR